MRALALAALLIAPALPGRAQEHYDADPLADCLALGKAEACIAAGAQACLETEAGSSTLGMAYCYTRAREDWDRRLNAAYATAVGEARALDADNAEGPSDLASSEEALRTAQRAWIAFRDAACGWEATRWSGGTGAGPASAACLMELTARQTLFLQDRLW